MRLSCWVKIEWKDVRNRKDEIWFEEAHFFKWMLLLFFCFLFFWGGLFFPHILYLTSGPQWSSACVNTTQVKDILRGHAFQFQSKKLKEGCWSQCWGRNKVFCSDLPLQLKCTIFQNNPHILTTALRLPSHVLPFWTQTHWNTRLEVPQRVELLMLITWQPPAP